MQGKAHTEQFEMTAAADGEFFHAIQAIREKDWQSALKHLQRAIRLEPGQAKFHAEAGAVLFMLGQRAESEKAYRRALDLEPDHLGALNNLAVICSVGRKYEEAEALLQRSLTQAPDQLDAWLNLCSVAESLDFREDDVVTYARRAVALSPRDPRPHRYLGKALLRQGNPLAALDAMKTALGLAPRNADTHYGIGVAYMELENISAAAQAFQTALAIDPVHGKTYYALAELLYRLEDFPAAEEACWQACGNLDDSITPRYLLAKILFALGRFDEAKNIYDEYRTLYHDHRARVLAKPSPGGRAILVPVEGIDRWCERKNLPVRETIPARRSPTAQSIRFGSTLEESAHPPGQVPHAYVAELEKAVILPGHEVILVDNEQTCLYDRLVTLQDRNNLMEDDTVRLIAADRVLLDIPSQTNRVLKEGIFLLDQFWYNYAHWLIEQLPRLWSIERFPEYAGMPLLINEKLYPQQMESIRLLTRGRHPIVPLPLGKQVRVERLVYPSNLTASMVMRYRPSAPATPMDVTLHAEAIRFLRDRLLPECAPNPRGGRRLWVSRKTKIQAGHRRLINEREVEALFLEHGFEIVVPETLSFREQIAAFADAEMIAGCAGAGMINTIFAPSHARILMFTKNHHQVNFHYFSNIARTIGQPIAYACGEARQNLGLHGFEADFAVDMDVARRALRDFLGA